MFLSQTESFERLTMMMGFDIIKEAFFTSSSSSSISSVPMLVTIIFTALAVVLGYLYKPFWGVRKVPSPQLIPLLGHLPSLAKYGLDVFSIIAKQYGPIFRSVF